MRTLISFVLSVMLVAACGGSDSAESEALSDDVVVLRANASRSPAEIFAAVSPSIVFVEVPDGAGSGVFLSSGFVATNAHVVGHHSTVRLFTSVGEIAEAPVYARDWVNDLALIGPLPLDQMDGALPALEFGTSASVSVGDDVYLIGYPGEIESRPEAAMTSGILSRRRIAHCIGGTFLQTDALIVGGQSGGVLVDAYGQLIGLSGLGGFADSFALVRAAEDVTASLNLLDEGSGDLLSAENRGSFTQSAEIAPGDAAGFLVTITEEQPWLSLTAKSEERHDVFVDINTWDGYEPNWNWRDGEIDYIYEEGELSEEDASPFFADAFSNGGPETLEVSLEPGMYVIATGVYSDVSTTVTVEASSPLTLLEDAETFGKSLTKGESEIGVLSFFMDVDTYLFDLQEGEVVRIQLVSVTGDPSMSLYKSGYESEVLMASSDDEGIGLYGDGAEIVFEAPVMGEYALDVTAVGDFPLAYSLTIDNVDRQSPSC